MTLIYRSSQNGYDCSTLEEILYRVRRWPMSRRDLAACEAWLATGRPGEWHSSQTFQVGTGIGRPVHSVYAGPVHSVYAVEQTADQATPASSTAAGPTLESAVEVVVRALEERGHHELARAVSVATDPTPPTEQAAAVAAAREYVFPERIVLDENGFAEFAAEIENPRKPNAALREVLAGAEPPLRHPGEPEE